MKFHWGHGIALFYSIFALALIIVVIQSTTFDNSLVVDDYYAQDIRYQETIDRRMNSQSLDQPVQLMREGDCHYLVFPINELSGAVSGEIQFYRASSKRFDRFQTIELEEEGRICLDDDELIPGYWQLKVNWTSAGLDYLDEFEIYLPPA
ncbi:MAG: FixH family protein [Bacteroidota bacterium]